MSGSDAANLARIRDNQRRSRARRKEYLQEIEGRLRECEQTGVEASTEIQAAARKVAVENQRLRLLLIKRGVSAEEINTFIYDQDFASHEAAHRATAERARSDDAAILEGLLAIGRRRCGQRQSETGAERRQMQPVLADIDTSNRMLPRSDSISETWTPPNSAPMQGPMSNVTSVTSTPTTMSPHNAQFHPQLQRTPQLQQHSPMYPTPILPSHYRQIEPQTTQPLPLQPQPAAAMAAFPQQQPHPFQMQNFVPSSIDSQQQSFAQPTSIGTNSCVYATELITGMTTDVHPGDVRADLGCNASCNANVDCQVDNRTVFDVMDRYSGIGR